MTFAVTFGYIAVLSAVGLFFALRSPSAKNVAREEGKQMKIKQGKPWRERFGLEMSEKDEYSASFVCDNCAATRGVFVKKGVELKLVTDAKCDRCGCGGHLR